MPKVSQWTKIFGRSKKPKVTVQVGDKAENLTETQAYRFEELAQTGSTTSMALNNNPLEQTSYSLEDAALRLMTSEEALLQRAASGTIGLYADATGLEGRWRRIDENGDAVESPLQTLGSGYLGLTILSCKEMAMHGSSNVLVLELPESVDPSTLSLDVEALLALSAWGDVKKFFCVHEPHYVDRNNVVLLAPLTDAGNATT